MTLATVDASGQPSQRIVLLKHLDEQGFVFYTNYGSTKARDISLNNKVSLHFPWHSMERQVKIMGTALKVPLAETVKYFLSRPRDSQIAAWASHQSSPLSSRSLLLGQFEALKQKFRHGEVPLPDFWGGYRIIPSVFEFWQGGGSRLHDRFQYTKNDDQWTIERLAP
jgi:pyridoxamine 5'-phosphate oxidase